jgi:hypothetical protein
MLKSGAPEVPEVYKVKAETGQFAAFWLSDDGRTMNLFLPGDMWEKYKQYDLSKWESLRDSYSKGHKHNLEAFNETVNAAWHFLALNSVFIDKSKVEPSTIAPGIYFPRIWRGFGSETCLETYNAVCPSREYGAKHLRSATAASSLFDYLVEIFRHVEPAAENFSTFSHKIRELLILICTEIEAGWRGVLLENGYSTKGNLNTNDYVKLLPVLRLKDWKVVIKDYPDVGTLAPLDTWNATSPTLTLPWYDAYNAVKHDREASFNKATFKNLLDAAAALHITQAAQWGPEIFSQMHDNRFSPFWITYIPTIAAADIYIAPLEKGAPMTAKPYFG